MKALMFTILGAHKVIMILLHCCGEATNFLILLTIAHALLATA